MSGRARPAPGRRRALLGGLAWAGAAALDTAAHAEEGPGPLYAALARGPATEVESGGARLRVVFDGGAPGLDCARVLEWISRNAAAVSAYYGRFPVARYGLLVVAIDGEHVGHGTTYGFSGSATRVEVGRDATAAALARDWVMAHEMVHTALPTLPRRALWLEEGNATWVEPVARARVGQLDVSEVWSQALRGMPQGSAAPREGGMDGAERWGRLYWGGAAFWLMAEIAVHEASAGRRSLRDALAAIARRSGGDVAEWSPERTMAVGDAATGTDALSHLYRRWAQAPVSPDLDVLFASLGVGLQAGRVVFDDGAPLASLRRAITAPA